MSRNVELESAIKYTISNPTRYNGFLRVAANNRGCNLYKAWQRGCCAVDFKPGPLR